MRLIGMWLLRSFLLFIAVTGLNRATYAQMTEIVNFGSNPGNLRGYMYLPEGYKSEKEYPLLVALHGCSQDAVQLAEESGWNKLADIHRFIILYPEQKRVNNASLCFNWFKQKDNQGEEGEAKSIIDMVEYVENHYSINSNKKLIYGLSAGAAMSVAILSTSGCSFNGGAVFAGGPFSDVKNGVEGYQIMNGKVDKTPEEWGSYLSEETKRCKPDLFVYHGLNDKMVSPSNAIELVEQWCFLHGVDTEPDSIYTSFEGVKDLTCKVFTNNEESRIVLYEISNLGHKLPINPGEREDQGGKDAVFTKNIGFHSTYHVAREFGLLSR